MAHLNESYDPKYLVCVTSSNNNKFYRILPDPDSQGFTVEYGRIGAPSFRTDHYPIDMYWRKYDEKLKKGYVDQTNLVKAAVAANLPCSTSSVCSTTLLRENISWAIMRWQT